MKNLQLIEVKYIPATNTSGSKVSLTDHRLDEKIKIPYDCAFNSTYDISEDYLNNKGFKIVGMSEMKNSYAILCDHIDGTFKSIK